MGLCAVIHIVGFNVVFTYRRNSDKERIPFPKRSMSGRDAIFEIVEYIILKHK
jgi:hypothetical protein